jgi:hypothetical protein
MRRRQPVERKGLRGPWPPSKKRRAQRLLRRPMHPWQQACSAAWIYHCTMNALHSIYKLISAHTHTTKPLTGAASSCLLTQSRAATGQ